MNGYELSRNWFDFAFENNSKITANHGILFFWLIEINNRLGWAKEFQITAKECMQGMGCHSYNTYKKCLDDLIKWEFIILKRKAVNQFQTNIIALSKNDKALYKAMDKALTLPYQKMTKQVQSTIQSTVQSTSDIHKPINKEIYKEFIFFDDTFSVLWNDYLEMRIKIRKPATLKAEKLAINLIKKYSDNDVLTARNILEQSILNSWQGIFNLKKDFKDVKKIQPSGMTVEEKDKLFT